jgi:hypothetical protein
MKQTDRRSFLKIAGSSLGIGVLYSAYPAALSAGEAGGLFCSPVRSHCRSRMWSLRRGSSEASTEFNKCFGSRRSEYFL